MNYIGLDIGDGESAVARYEQGSLIEPVVLPVCGERSLLSAVGMRDGEAVIGPRAYTDALAQQLSVRFKSRYSREENAQRDMLRFVRTLIADLQSTGSLPEDAVFTVGCPAGWNQATRDKYRALMLRAGVANPRLISESRAAFLYARYAKTVALDPDALEESALVIDIGSSTLDFAWIVDGRESSIGTFGETALGGGLMDAAILRRATDRAQEREAIRQTFSESPSWYSYCEIETRRAKEEYYNRLVAGENPEVRRLIRLYYDGVQKLNLRLDGEEMDAVIREPMEELGGMSFLEALTDALRNAVSLTAGEPPKLLLLTGGASRMPFFSRLCRDFFPKAQVVACPEPEFSIAKGLAYAGWVEENLEGFRAEIAREMSEERLQQMALDQTADLTVPLSGVLSSLIVENAAIPCAKSWKKGEIRTLEQMSEQITRMIPKVLATDAAREQMQPVLTHWLETMTKQLAGEVGPICDRYHVPRRQMDLRMAAQTPGDLSLDARRLIGLEWVTTLTGTLVTVLSAVLCGGSGVALIAAGPVGLLAGAAIGAIAALIGGKPIQSALMKADLPRLLRKIPIDRRMTDEDTRNAVKESILQDWVPRGSSFAGDMAAAFAKAFGEYIQRTARSAEVPIE